MPLLTLNEILGTVENDPIATGLSGVDASETASSINGLQGDDVIVTGTGNDLTAGDMVGEEWTFDNGEWVYDAAKVVISTYGADTSYDDIITTGAGDDVLLGNGGHDQLFSGAGNDRVNAGSGDDFVFGGNGDDVLNLEDGNDYAEGGYGDDTINGGAGDDVIFGDVAGDNLLEPSAGTAVTIADHVATGGWTMEDTFGSSTISQSAATVAGETYTVSFGLAANLAGGHAAAAVEVIWNGEVIETVTAVTGAYETFEVDVVSNGTEGTLTFNTVEADSDVTYNFDGPIISYEKTMTIQGEEVDVQGFAAGQANLYQVIDGQLNVFDVDQKSYEAVGDQPDFKINAIGFNIEDDLLYGVAKSGGTDSLGNTVSTSDIVMVDAAGDTYRIGEGFYGDYVGDFDDSGNLWTFHSALNRLSVVDVDNLDADGNPSINHFTFPNAMFTDRTYDMAFNAADGNFYAVVSPDANGQAGKVVKIDVSNVLQGGEPTFTEIEIRARSMEMKWKPVLPKAPMVQCSLMAKATFTLA